ncbi:hypothetical protein L6452_19136 [Arctium lappa]|uniref:Uncharacterized protein n=1 Tax=Arctium lappa TaxID=4217 RepID=A0ACB9B8A2_ARCLA|nr:hypothetical protein L6452_19136 [Arctium lappa]
MKWQTCSKRTERGENQNMKWQTFIFFPIKTCDHSGGAKRKRQRDFPSFSTEISLAAAFLNGPDSSRKSCLNGFCNGVKKAEIEMNGKEKKDEGDGCEGEVRLLPARVG